VPEYTSLVFVPSGIKVKYPVESSKPKKPVLAAEPLCHLNSIPRSLLSSAPGGVSPPTVKIGSSTVMVALFTVVVVPLTVKSPVTVKLPPTVPLLEEVIVVNDPAAGIVPALISAVVATKLLNVPAAGVAPPITVLSIVPPLISTVVTEPPLLNHH
jgi:hypothetical protein